jgi:hypothetical protein
MSPLEKGNQPMLFREIIAVYCELQETVYAHTSPSRYFSTSPLSHHLIDCLQFTQPTLLTKDIWKHVRCF